MKKSLLTPALDTGKRNGFALLALSMLIGNAGGVSLVRPCQAMDTSGATAAQPQRIVVAGRALGADDAPAAFATISDCHDAMCKARSDGTFNCSMPRPQHHDVCIEHPVLGRTRIQLAGRTGRVDIGTVRLVAGGTVRVMRPPNLELPEGTTALLRRQGSAARETKIEGREEIEFNGLSPADYELLLSGPGPLERKVFPVSVSGFGVQDLVLSIDPFALSGEVRLGDTPLTDAVISLQCKSWQAKLNTDATGRFSAKVWDAASYSVMVTSPALRHPYGVMKLAGPAEREWVLTIPKRRITGSVIVAATGKRVGRATVRVRSNSGETRWSRNVETADDGTFDIDGVGAGDYELAAEAPGYLSGNATRLTIGAREGDREIVLSLEQGHEVAISVTGPTGTPLAGAWLIQEAADGTRPPRVGKTGPDGSYTATVREDTSDVLFVLPAEGSFATRRISSSDTSLRIVVPQAAATLTLRTQNENREPLSNVAFMMRYEGQTISANALRTLSTLRGFPVRTDATGTSSIRALPAGRFEIGWYLSANSKDIHWVPVQLTGGEIEIVQTFGKR